MEPPLPEPQPLDVATPVAAPSAFETWLRGNWGWLAAIAALTAAAVGAWRYLRWRQIDLFRDTEVLSRLFALLGLWATRLHIPWRSSQTPLEKAAAFNASLPEAAPAVDTIANLFIAQQYGRQQPRAESITGLARAWQQLQPRLWKRWLVGQVRKPDVK